MNMPPSPKPPIAEKVPHTISQHGDDRNDDYFWIRNRENPEVMAYLAAENAYTEEVLRPHKEFQERIFEELKSRIKEDDKDVPVRIDDWYYFSRYSAGQQYPVYCRKHHSLESAEQVILDCNQLAQGKPYFSLGAFEVSSDHKTLAFSTDYDGSEKYTLQFKNLETGELLPDQVTHTAGSVVWAEDHSTVFYTLLDANQRPDRLFRHRLGTPTAQDTLVHQETDPHLFVYCDKSRSRRYIFLQLFGKVTSEYSFIDAAQPESAFKTIEPRRQGVLYSVEHHDHRFFILANDTHPNFRLCEAPVDKAGKENWQELIAASDSRFLQEVDAFEDHLVLKERENGLPQIRVIEIKTWKDHLIEFPEPSYNLSPTSNPEFHTRTFRFLYTSMVTPSTVFDYEMNTRAREVKKVQEIPGGYDAANYQSERIFATAQDGTRVPISLVYRKGFKRDGSSPLYLYGYGSYGINSPASFASTRLSLLDRGFVVAIAHIRGGSEMGRPWYEDGKFLKKMNTFTDFIACAEHLISEKYTSKGQIVIVGGSAGGMLVGAVVNMRPDLFKGVVAHVPFVDVVNTMLDSSLPLTQIEYEEWGNPNEPQFYHCMKSYSPYDNVERKDYPHILVTGGLNDPRVTYWEPTKWVARLRDMKTDTNLLLLHMHMEAGHGGASGRFEALRDKALEYTFIFKIFNLIPAEAQS